MPILSKRSATWRFCLSIRMLLGFTRCIAFAIAIVVTSRSSSFEYIISVHAVHAGANITFLFAPACTACTDMVYSKNLECDVTTIAMANVILCLKTLASFLHRPRSVRFLYVGSTNKGCYIHAMCKMLLF